MIWRRKEGQEVRLGVNWNYVKGRYINVIIAVPLWVGISARYEDWRTGSIIKSWILYTGTVGIHYSGWILSKIKGTKRNFHFMYGVEGGPVGKRTFIDWQDDMKKFYTRLDCENRLRGFETNYSDPPSLWSADMRRNNITNVIVVPSDILLS
jgi:hypothetical protein